MDELLQQNKGVTQGVKMFTLFTFALVAFKNKCTRHFCEYENLIYLNVKE